MSTSARPEPPLRVLLLVKGLGLGGAERLLVEQATAPERRVDYAVASVRPDKQHFVPALEAAGVPVTVLGGRRLPWPLGLARLLRAQRPAVVHAHSPLVAAVARVLVRAGVAGRRARLVSTEHNVWSAYRLPTRVANALTLPLDHHRWAVSEVARASMRPGWLRRRVVALHHGVDVEAVRAAAAEGPADAVPPRPDGAVVLVHVANKRPEKNHELLLDAFARVAARRPEVHLWLVGQHLERDGFLDRVAASPAADRIHVLGYRSDATALIAAGDLVVLSSDQEGLPVVVMEALALGRPVVATAVGGLPEAITDGVEGRLVPPGDAAALASALGEVVGDADGRAAMGVAAAGRAAAFDAGRARQVQEALYRELVR